MSFEIAGSIWNYQGNDLRGADKNILVRMAWFASFDGRNIYPSIQTLIEQSGYSRSTVFRSLLTLKKNNFLIVENATPGRPVKYKINLHKLNSKIYITDDTESSIPENISQSMRGCHPDTGGGVILTPNKLFIKTKSNNNAVVQFQEIKEPFRHQIPLASDDPTITKILEKAKGLKLPLMSVMKLIKKHGRTKVERTLDLMSQQQNEEIEIKKPIAWFTKAVQEDWAEEAPKTQSESTVEVISDRAYIEARKDKKIHSDALAALNEAGVTGPVWKKGMSDNRYFKAQEAFNIQLSDKMRKLEQQQTLL